ncbi:unnamed protein product [marine sediment metagenome]|uniref:Uncharacterized protein n=1 Tax=marine sediment metagenome TaxID=412755 RepID=X0TLK0_9ZZZZ
MDCSCTYKKLLEMGFEPKEIRNHYFKCPLFVDKRYKTYEDIKLIRRNWRK